MSSPRNIIFKLSKVKHNERSLKTIGEKHQVTCRKLIRLTPDFSAETLQARRKWDAIFKVLKKEKRKLPNKLCPNIQYFKTKKK